MPPGCPTKEEIDACVAGRDIAGLAYFIRSSYLEPELRQYLAEVVSGLLTRKMSFPSRRPKGTMTLWKRRDVAERVWIKHKRLPKISRAVAEVAKELKCSERKVWACWEKGAYVGLFEAREEEARYEAMAEAAYDQRWNDARDSLVEKHGPERDFTDEEIAAEAKVLDEAMADWYMGED